MSDKAFALRVARELDRREAVNTRRKWRPYPKQLEFLHDTKKTKVLMGGNQSGKSHTLAFELSLHLDGNYPDWWKGVRFDRPVVIWVAGTTHAKVRDTLQKKLFGEVGRWGTGMLPLDAIATDPAPVKRQGTPNAYEMVWVKHKSGLGLSKIQFYAYSQDPIEFAGDEIDIMAYDEEPPQKIRSEANMRTIARNGYDFYTFTPVDGVTELTNYFMYESGLDIHYLTWDDVKHLTEEAKAKQIAGLLPHEIQARKYGRPAIGTGLVYPYDPSRYVISPFKLERWWPRIGGLDVGISHPTGAVAIAYDPESKTSYVYQDYRVSGETPVYHASHLKKWGIQFAIDPAAASRAIATGKSAMAIYEEEGLRIFKANNNAEYGVGKVRTGFAEESLFVFSTCTSLIEELRLYRFNEKGEIIKVKDDVVDPLRYGYVSLDKAEVMGMEENKNFEIKQWKPATRGY